MLTSKICRYGILCLLKGLPVPVGFVIDSETCKEVLEHNAGCKSINRIATGVEGLKLPDNLMVECRSAVRELEVRTSKCFGVENMYYNCGGTTLGDESLVSNHHRIATVVATMPSLQGCNEMLLSSCSLTGVSGA